MSDKGSDDPFAEGNEAIARGEYINTPTRSLRGQGVVDPRDIFQAAPAYTLGQLPEIFENYVIDACASWGGDPGTYACAFIAMHCSVLHESVVMNTNPLKPNNWRHPNDFSLTVGRSGDNKSGLWRDLTKMQAAWQQAMTRATVAKVGGKSTRTPPAVFLQTASVEGMMAQLADNNGERLVIGAEEAMMFYGSAGAHHRENAVMAMSDAVCTVYDGGMFSKRLVNKLFSVPSALATIITTTVSEKIAGWQSFGMMIDSGLMARHTVGIISNPRKRDESMLIPHAEERMHSFLLSLRALRHVRFVLEPGADQAWLRWTSGKEGDNTGLEMSDAAPGLINWARKYDMRIMSMATILQAYDYIQGGEIEHQTHEELSTEADASKVDGGKKVVKTVFITRRNLSRAIKFVDGYLFSVQEFFYNVSVGMSEWGKEIVNFLAHRLTVDDPTDPDCRILSRDNFTWSGPTSVRRGSTEVRKEKARRWIGTLLDFGIIEVYDHPNARKLKQRRADEDERWYKIRDEVFEKFGSDEDRAFFATHDRKMKEHMAANGIGPLRKVRELDDD